MQYLTLIVPGEIIATNKDEGTIEIKVETGPPPIKEEFYQFLKEELGPKKAARVHDELVDEIAETTFRNLIRIEPTKV
jgi:hypothetical protein